MPHGVRRSVYGQKLLRPVGAVATLPVEECDKRTSADAGMRHPAGSWAELTVIDKLRNSAKPQSPRSLEAVRDRSANERARRCLLACANREILRARC